MQRTTSQREIIKDYLKSTKSHPTAEMVFRNTRKTLPRISLSTVYRNLKDMADDGDILEIADKTVRYDGDISHHAHFFCDKCGKVYDIYEKIHHRNHRNHRIPGKAERMEIRFYGICNSCKK